MSAETPQVLVTDAHSTSALGVVRSLGSRGIRVTTAGEEGRFNLAAHSRHVERAVVWPSAEDHPLAYLDHMEAELQRTQYDLLLPTTDTTVTLVRHRRQRLEQLVRIALPANEVLEAAQDKAITMRVAAQTCVTIPRTWTFSSMADVEVAAPGLPYPCVIKPRFSRQWTGIGPLTRGTVSYADSSEALLARYRRAQNAPESLLVQELVNGTGVGVFVLADHGRPLAVFAHRRVREANPTGGRASLAESIFPDDRLIAPALRILAALGWTGVAMVEFKDPGSPAPPILMEVNGRFWGSLPLAIAAGVDFPAMLVQLILSGEIAAPRAYKVGVRCRHLKGDISYLIAALKGRPRHWHGAYPTRLGAVAAITPWPGRWRPYNFSVTDPMPALYEAGDFLFREARALASGVLARAS